MDGTYYVPSGKARVPSQQMIQATVNGVHAASNGDNTPLNSTKMRTECRENIRLDTTQVNEQRKVQIWESY